MNLRGLLGMLVVVTVASTASAQTPPTQGQIAGYDGLLRAAHDGDLAALERLIADGASLDARDGAGRTALHIAAFASHDSAVQSLAAAGADLNALENQAYDIVTIAAVANDLAMVDTALNVGARAGNVTSIYDGTALIAAAHLGHHQVVARLIAGGAPLDHINNLGWTALIEAVVLGNGGAAHVATARALVDAGADRSIGDKNGVTPLEHAERRDYKDMIAVIGK